MSVPEVTCDFCERFTEPAQDFAVIIAKPSPLVMCEQCKRRVAETLGILRELALMHAEPATELVC